MSYDLSKLYVKVDDDTKKSFVKETAELSSFQEFIKAGDFITKVAILSGDIDSPFALIKDRELMIRSIFEYLGKKDDKLMQSVILFKSELYLDAWTKYLFILNETSYTDWMLAKKDYEYLLKESNKEREGIDGIKDLQKLNTLRKTIKDLGEEVRSLEAKLFPDSKAAREASLHENKKIKLYPEMYAEEGGFV